MIVKDEFLGKLRGFFSLNLYEVKIWTALLSRGVSTAGELSDIANVPRSRSYDVLESLEKKGFVIMKLGKPIKYIAVPPKEVVERVKKNVQDYAKAEESVTMMTTAQGFLRKVEGLKPTFEKLKKRGVKIRIAAPLTKESVAALKELQGIAEVRNTDTKARFCIVDGKEIIFMVLDDNEVHPTYDVGIWVNTPFFASALENLFELAWKNMKPAAEVIKR